MTDVNTDPVLESDYWCTTTSGDTTVTTFTWKIEDLESLTEKNGEFISSSTFSAEIPNDYYSQGQWHLSLYPKGQKKDQGDHVSIYLFLTSPDDCSVSANYEVSILDSKKIKKVKTESIGNKIFDICRMGRVIGANRHG